MGNWLKDYKLTDIDMYEDETGWYLRVAFRAEDEKSIRDLIAPKVLLCRRGNFAPRIAHSGDRLEIDFGTGFKTCLTGIVEGVGEGELLEHVVEYKIHKMTLEEIEQKLGYKVKIVDSKEA